MVSETAMGGDMCSRYISDLKQTNLNTSVLRVSDPIDIQSVMSMPQSFLNL